MESDTDFSLYIPKSIWGKKKKNIEEQRNVIPVLKISINYDENCDFCGEETSSAD